MESVRRGGGVEAESTHRQGDWWGGRGKVSTGSHRAQRCNKELRGSRKDKGRNTREDMLEGSCYAGTS